MPRVTEIAFTGYPVSNIARARAFYEGIFQLKPANIYEHGDMAWIERAFGWNSPMRIRRLPGDRCGRVMAERRAS